MLGFKAERRATPAQSLDGTFRGWFVILVRRIFVDGSLAVVPIGSELHAHARLPNPEILRPPNTPRKTGQNPTFSRNSYHSLPIENFTMGGECPG
jgi:hypothetical protein